MASWGKNAKKTTSPTKCADCGATGTVFLSRLGSLDGSLRWLCGNCFEYLSDVDTDDDKSA